MNIIKLCVIAMMIPVITHANVEDKRTTKTADSFCYANDECKDIVSLELDGMYHKGLNERAQVSVGALINRKAKEFGDFCLHTKDKTMCENYKNQLMLKYITGLLDR